MSGGTGEGPDPRLADLNLRIELMRLREQAAENQDWPLISILDVAVRTVDGRIPADGSAPQPTTLLCRTVTVMGEPTQVRLEAAFWQALDGLARRLRCGIDALCDAAMALPGAAGDLPTALRVYTLLAQQRAANSAGK